MSTNASSLPGAFVNLFAGLLNATATAFADEKPAKKGCGSCESKRRRADGRRARPRYRRIENGHP